MVLAAMAYAWLRAIGSRKHRRALVWGRYGVKTLYLNYFSGS